jgi:hypothetical protein
MRTRHLAAPFVLLYWQLGPIPQPLTEPDGTVRWSVSGMAAGGQWEDATFDCDGNLTSSEAIKYRDIGGRVDIEEPRSGLRFTAVAGSARRSSASVPNGMAYNQSVATYGGMVAWEGRHVGLGGGVLHDPDGVDLPSVYLRLGRRETAHFRMEVEPLSETRMQAGAFRSGVGFKDGFVGVTFSPYLEKFSQIALFGDINVPLARNLDLRLAGTAGPGIETAQWGIGAGLRLHR